MGSIQAEFHNDEETLMREIFTYLDEKLGPKKPAPPMKNTAGKWHFYIEMPDHKRKTKANKRAAQ